MTTRRKFTDEEKLVILSQAEKIGISATLRHYSLSYSVFAKWKQKFMTQDPNQHPDTFKTRTKLRQLYNENIRLKKIIADQALEIERKEEELKKITKK
jgi:putative transposase